MLKSISKVLGKIGIVDDDTPKTYTASMAYADRQAQSRRNNPNTYVPKSNRTDETRRRTMVPDKQQNTRAPEREERRPASRPVRNESAQMARRNDNAPAQRPNGGSAVWTKYSVMRLNECGGIVDSLINGEIVLVLLDRCDPSISQRVIDTLSGAAYALKAKVERASSTAYLITPKNIAFRSNSYDTYNKKYFNN